MKVRRVHRVRRVKKAVGAIRRFCAAYGCSPAPPFVKLRSWEVERLSNNTAIRRTENRGRPACLPCSVKNEDLTPSLLRGEFAFFEQRLLLYHILSSGFYLCLYLYNIFAFVCQLQILKEIRRWGKERIEERGERIGKEGFGC